MSNRTKEEQRRASLPEGMLPKAERRALGKQAALKRARAKRNRRIFNNLAVAGVGLVVVAVIAAAFGAFSGDSGTPAAAGSAGPSASAAEPTPEDGFQTPAGADPKLLTKPVVTKGTGDVTKLNVATLVQGTGAAVVSGQEITVNYVGVDYKTGTEFDSSWAEGKSISFSIGTGGVIPGWDQGLPGIKIGSRVQLDIPADLAYGENPTGGQPPGDLRFVVDILDSK